MEKNDNYTKNKDNNKINIKLINLARKYNNITNEFIFDKKDIKYNTPVSLKYNNKLFNIATNDFHDKIEETWKCCHHRSTKDKPKNERNFRNPTIKEVKDIFIDKFTIFLKEKHSTISLEMKL